MTSEDLMRKMFPQYLRSQPDAVQLSQGDMVCLINKAREGMVSVDDVYAAVAKMDAYIIDDTAHLRRGDTLAVIRKLGGGA